MPPSTKMLMYQAVPIDARYMNNADDYKFNGLKREQIVGTAQYLLAIQESERKDIIERMLLSCKPRVVGSICEEYTKAAPAIQRNNLAHMLDGHAVVCDESGVLH